MSAIASMLRDLGFKKVVALFDANKKEAADAFRKEFPEYKVFEVAADDVRTKAARKEKPEIKGLLDEHGKVRPEYSNHIRDIIVEANEHVAR
jgi:hypothetical protein